MNNCNIVKQQVIIWLKQYLPVFVYIMATLSLSVYLHIAITLLVLMKLSHTNGQTTEWRKDQYPNPQSEEAKCGMAHPSWICDPDDILDEDDGKYFLQQNKLWR